jgi:hypothetical protein
MSAEAVRAVPATKRAAHYPDFSTFVELLGYFDLDTSLMTTNWTEDVWLNERCLERGEKLMQQLVDRLVAATHADQLLKHLYPRHVDEVPLPSSGWFDSIALELRDTRLELKRLAQIEARLVNDCKEAIGDACGIAGAWGRIDWKANKNGVRSFTPRFIKEEV